MGGVSMHTWHGNEKVSGKKKLHHKVVSVYKLPHTTHNSIQ